MFIHQFLKVEENILGIYILTCWNDNNNKFIKKFVVVNGSIETPKYSLFMVFSRPDLSAAIPIATLTRYFAHLFDTGQFVASLFFKGAN